MSKQLIKQGRELLKKAQEDFNPIIQRVVEAKSSEIDAIKLTNKNEVLVVVTIYEDN